MTFVSQISQFAMGIGLVLGALLALAGMGDPGLSGSAPAPVQLLPLSGPVVVGAMVVGIRASCGQASASRGGGAKLIGVAMIVIAVAAWIALAAPSTRGLASALAIIALPPLVAGCALIQARPNDAR